MSSNIVPSSSTSTPLTYAQANSIFLSKSNLITALSQLTGTITLPNTVVSPTFKVMSGVVTTFNVIAAGKVSTWRNTLDDNNGNAIFNSMNNSPTAFIVNNGSSQAIFTVAASGGGSVLINSPGNNSNALVVKNSLNAAVFNVNASTNSVQTKQNTLDDGSGNMTVVSVSTPSLRINNISIDQSMMIGASSGAFTQSIGSLAGDTTTIKLPDLLYNSFDPSILSYNATTGLITNNSASRLVLEVSFCLGLGPVNYPNSTSVLGYLLGSTLVATTINNSDGNTPDMIGGQTGIILLNASSHASLTTVINDPGSSGTPIFVRVASGLNCSSIHIRYLSSS